MADYDLLHVKAVDAQLRVKPSVITYSRLEPVNLSSGDLSPGLQMLIADPLWMVGRQWQFDELHGEDGGSPILAEVTGEAGPVTRFLAGAAGNDPAGAAVDVDQTCRSRLPSKLKPPCCPSAFGLNRACTCSGCCGPATYRRG
jgi:hypothetical protein